MRILITGVCGFVGGTLARVFRAALPGSAIFGIDNLLRPGSELNRSQLRSIDIEIYHGDLRLPSDVGSLPAADWVVDAAANPSVLAGVDGRCSSRQLIEHNLGGTINLLEFCKQHAAGLILLSTSRVYSIPQLSALPMAQASQSFALDAGRKLPSGVSPAGIAEGFSVGAPVSLYGSTKLASETLALEYGFAFDFPVWIDRCGVLAGAGQFGTAEQGIFSYWMHAHAARRPLRYIGFGGTGYQVRDAFHPEDLARLVMIQMADLSRDGDRVFNAGGGAANSISLARLNATCNERFGSHEPSPDLRDRPFDLPWVVMDSAKAKQRFGWEPKRTLPSILDEIEAHVRNHPEWLDMCDRPGVRTRYGTTANNG